MQYTKISYNDAQIQIYTFIRDTDIQYTNLQMNKIPDTRHKIRTIQDIKTQNTNIPDTTVNITTSAISQHFRHS